MNLILAGLVSYTCWRALEPEDSLFVKILVPLLVAVFTLVFILGGQLLLCFLTLFSKRNKTILTEHTVTLSEEGLTEETAYNVTLQKWKGVQRLLRTREYLFIYVSDLMAHVIPRKAFGSAHDDDVFYAFCQEKAQSRS